MASGFAYVKNGEIDMKTVHETENAAMFNAMFMYFGIVPQDSWNERKVKTVFNACCPEGGKITAVTVEVTLDPRD